MIDFIKENGAIGAIGVVAGWVGTVFTYRIQLTGMKKDISDIKEFQKSNNKKLDTLSEAIYRHIGE